MGMKMEKNMFLRYAIIVGILLLVSCDTQGPVVEPARPSFGATIKLSSGIFGNAKGQGDMKKVRLMSNRAWFVEMDQEAQQWVTVSEMEGEASSLERVLTITLKPNIETDKARRTMLHFRHAAPDTAVVHFEIIQISDYNFLKDSLALLDIYHQLGGDNWTHPWDLSAPVALWGRTVKTALGDSWDGVWLGKVNGERRVTSLWFWETNNVVGRVPEDIGRLTALMGLRFYGEKGLTGELPLKAWANCKEMGRITFIKCNLEGTLTSDFGLFPNVDALELAGNNFSAVEGGFGFLPNLVALSIGNNKLTGKLEPSWFDGLPKMVILDVAGNDFEGELDPQVVVGKSNLMMMSARDNRFVGDFPRDIKSHIVWYNNPDAVELFCPQQTGYGFTKGTCE